MSECQLGEMERSAGEASTSGMEDPRDHASPYFPDRMLSSSGALHEAKARRQIRDAWAFWLLGLLNNSGKLREAHRCHGGQGKDS